MTCYCFDPCCPHHPGRDCPSAGGARLYRIDMDDPTGTPMCAPCAEDAFASGLFSRCAPREYRRVRVPPRGSAF